MKSSEFWVSSTRKKLLLNFTEGFIFKIVIEKLFSKRAKEDFLFWRQILSFSKNFQRPPEFSEPPMCENLPL